MTTHEQTSTAVTSLGDLLGAVQATYAELAATGAEKRGEAEVLHADVSSQRADTLAIASVNTDYSVLQNQAADLQTEAATLKARVGWR